jgi:hypothetical protein
MLPIEKTKIYANEKSLLFILLSPVSSITWAQQVMGRVSRRQRWSPLSGVSVFIKNKGGTTTNNDGAVFPFANAVLVFTFTGFTDKKRRSQRRVECFIGTGAKPVGSDRDRYSLQNKRQSSGSVAKVSGDEIKCSQLVRLIKPVEKVPGFVSIFNRPAGAAAEVTISGKGSINGTNTRFIDGIQVNAADFATIVRDIESILY